ncbi:hypothetical protein F441_12739, partial [Phytophthora nicotianae CJ01A1]
MSEHPSSNGVDMDAELAQLLLEQEQFLNQKKQPAAKVSRRGGPPKVSASKTPQKASESTPDESPQVLKGVVERQVTPVGQQSFVFTPKPSGFPSVKRRGPGQSLFGRRRREVKAKEQEQEKHVDQESKDIDAANKAKLQEMSPQEILEAQQELLRTLDPELVKKLKNRNKKERKREENMVKTRNKVAIGESIMKHDEGNEQIQKEEMIKSLAAVKTEEELKEQAKLLPAEERAKLDWTQTTKKDEKVANGKKIALPVAEDATLERFDLDGKLLEATDAELPVHSGLFHHGDDPDAAGYTLPELLHLARSSVASQRAMALNVVAKILHNRQLQERAGLRVTPRVLPRDMAMTLRIVLDDQNYTALSAGVSALHAFIVPVEDDSDEDFLSELKYATVVLPRRVHLHRNGATKTTDHSHGVEEVVYIDTTEADDGTSISDEDLAALDPVQALLSMDLGTRLRYILESIQLPDQYATEKMLDILIAVARHSPRAAHEISSNVRLLKLLQQQYVENEQVLTFQEGNIRSLQLSLKALELVRALCQGQRSVASALIASGLVQSTKGFLALKEVPSGDVDEAAAVLFGKMQVESLRIWRILLGYGLDFHCFAYLFPALASFMQHSTDASTTRNVALFAALESFCGLGSVHEAQHYFNQLGFFLDAAKDEAVRCIRSLLVATDDRTVALLSTTLRFLAAASAHATKYNLETADLVEVLKLLQSTETTRELLPRLNDTVTKRDLLVAIVQFHRQIVSNGLLSDDMDDDDIVQTFSRQVKTPLLIAATSAVASSSTRFSLTLIQACELTLLLGDLIATGQSDVVNFNADFVQSVYHQALILVERLGGGGEFLTARLFAGVLFHQSTLQSLGVFSEKADATRMSRVLTPIYQALVNATSEQEAHSAHIFTGVSSVNKFSYHLRLPQEEQSYIPSNLPLPSFWMVSPLSRIEYNSTENGKPSTDVGPTRAQSDEMKLIVSATCRFVFEFERLAPSMASIPSIAELRPEDKLFHLMHVLFAGSDVLFDDHVDAALRQLLPKLIKPILRSADSKLLYAGILRNLKRFQSLESGQDLESSKSSVSFSSDEQQVLTFVEKLVAEFTASSFGNSHFAQCMTLLLTGDFPLELRKFVWKELQEAHLLHTLAPFEVSSVELFKRCTRAVSTDAKLLQFMQQAVCKKQVSPTRGAFAYSVAIYCIVIYLFGEGGSTMSFARQQFAQTLTTEASPVIWGHLLTYNANDLALLSEKCNSVLTQRVDKLRTQAGLSSDQLLAFEATVSLLESTK